MAETRAAVQEIKNTTTGPVTWETMNVDGHSVRNRPGTIILIRNGGVGAVTATVTKQRDSYSAEGVGEFTVADLTKSCSDGEVTPLVVPEGRYNDGAGDLHINVDSDHANQEIAVLYPAE